MARPQDPQQHLNQITTLIEQIRHQITLNNDEETLCVTSLHQFETIDLPFQAIQAAIEFCGSAFSPESLGEISQKDEESINAWAIALTQTLQIYLKLLERWQPQLATLPLPEALKQQISDRTAQLQHIAEQQSLLLQSNATLLSQEAQLRQDAKALQQLKKKAKLLKAITTELQTTDLNSLRDRISTQEAAIAPQRQELETLKQQKAELDSELASLQQQRTALEAQINHLQQHLQHQQQRLEAGTGQTVQQLITLTAAEQQRLSQELNSLLADLSSQQQEYQQTQEKLASAIAESNRYQKETEQLRQHLQQYYQSNQEIAENLPVNRQKIDTIVKTIEQNLAQLDQELAQALQQQEEAEKKTIFTF
jgi:DNA repair exonuclease SbcCD ATPase subunit